MTIHLFLPSTDLPYNVFYVYISDKKRTILVEKLFFLFWKDFMYIQIWTRQCSSGSPLLDINSVELVRNLIPVTISEERLFVIIRWFMDTSLLKFLHSIECGWKMSTNVNYVRIWKSVSQQ
jgi:hypothetical protein